MIIKEKLMEEIIIDKADKLRNKLVEIIDVELNQLHNEMTYGDSLFSCKYAKRNANGYVTNFDELKQVYFKLIGLKNDISEMDFYKFIYSDINKLINRIFDGNSEVESCTVNILLNAMKHWR